MKTFFGLTEAGKSLIASSRRAALTPALLCAAAVVAIAAPAHAAACCLADIHNGWDPNNGNPTGYELDFQGDVTNVIPPQVAEDTLVNPFYGLYLYNGSPYNQISVTYVPNAQLTRVILSGGALPNPEPANFPGPHHLVNGVQTYHTGLNQGWNYSSQPHLVSRHWLYGDGSTVELQALSVAWDGKLRKNGTLAWAAIYVQTQKQGTGTWHLTAYEPGSKIRFRINNDGGIAVPLGVIGVQLGLSGPSDPNCLKTPKCEGNQAALDQLNDQYFPIPGETGSKFITVKKIPKKPLQTGQSFVFTAP